MELHAQWYGVALDDRLSICDHCDVARAQGCLRRVICCAECLHSIDLGCGLPGRVLGRSSIPSLSLPNLGTGNTDGLVGP